MCSLIDSKIINGDSLIELTKLPSESFDLIFSDPPYWMRTEGVLHRIDGSEFQGCNDSWDQFASLEDYESFSRQWLTECRRLLKPSGSIWVIGSMQCIYTIGAIMQRLGYWLINNVIWHKTNPTPNFTGSRLNNSHETLIWAVKNRSAKFTFHYKTAKAMNTESPGRQMGSVWKFPVCSGRERLKDSQGRKIHTTQKPLALLERIIAISSNIGDNVLDPFAGTMTTGVAAKKLGRNYVMIERDENYCRHGRARLDGVRFVDCEISRADFDVKPIRVTITEMIEAGYFREGEKFFLEDGNQCAELQHNGKLLYCGKIYDIHSCAALAKNLRAKRVNGFDFWYVMRGGSLVSIKSVREDYRRSLTEFPA